MGQFVKGQFENSDCVSKQFAKGKGFVRFNVTDAEVIQCGFVEDARAGDAILTEQVTNFGGQYVLLRNSLNKNVLVLICPTNTAAGMAMRLSSYKSSVMQECKKQLKGEEVYSLRVTDASDVSELNDQGSDVLRQCPAAVAQPAGG